MKHSKLFLLMLSLLFALNLSAQREQTIAGRTHGWTGLWGGYRHQLTQFNNSTSYINGGFFGFEFGKALLIGWGRYSLIDEFEWDNLDNQQFDLHWSPFIAQYGFQNFRAIHPQIGFEIGKGRVELGDRKDRILVMQPTAGVEINIFRWFHLCLDGGYRFVSDASIPNLTDRDLSGWMGQATLKFGFSWGRYHKKAPDNNKPKHYED